MKKCIKCGRDLPDNAAFCPYCETVQGKVTYKNTPSPWRRRVLSLFAIILTIAVILQIRHSSAPKILDAKGTELDYKGYRLILTYDEPMEEGELPEPEDNYEDWLSAEDEAAMMSLLYVYRVEDSKNARHIFEDLIDHATVETVPRDNAEQMECEQPHYDTFVPDAMMLSEFYYMPATGTNDILWTITMKNGDVLKLQHSFTCYEIPTAIFTPEDTSLDTIEDLQALLDHIETGLDPETVVFICLPAVTYEGGLIMDKRAYNLIGTKENGVMTTFTGTMEVHTREPEKAQLHNIRFSGSELGVAAYAPVGLFDCTFEDLPVGLAVYNGYADPHHCLFENCGTGMLYDCPESSRHGDLDLDGCAFRNNEIGMHLKEVANSIAMIYNGCTFSGNAVNIRNDASTPIDTSEARFD